MKKLTKILAYMAVITILMALTIPVGAFAFAEEIAEPTVEAPTTEVEEEPTITEPEEVITSEDDASNFFNDKILPYLISGCTGILGFAITIMPYIKKAGKAKLLEGLATSQKNEISKSTKQNNELQKTISTAIELLPGIVQEVKNIKNVLETSDFASTLKELSTRQDEQDANMLILLSKLDNLINGAKIAWKEAEGCTEILSKNPDNKVMIELFARVSEMGKIVAELQGNQTKEINQLAEDIKAIGGGSIENEN